MRRKLREAHPTILLELISLSNILTWEGEEGEKELKSNDF